MEPKPVTGRRLRFALVFALVMFAVSGTDPMAPFSEAQTASAPDSTSPTGVTLAFYRGYLQALARPGSDPLLKEQAMMRTFVAPALLTRLKRQRTGPDPPEVDYFIKAQDYFDDWQDSLEAVPGRSNDKTAIVAVSMGKTSATRSRLRVTLIRVGGRWKISVVTSLLRDS